MRNVIAKGALALALLAAPAATTPVLAAGGGAELLPAKFTFEGPFGTYDRAAAQRGFQIYKEVCAACHSMSLVAYRNLMDLGLTENQVKALAAEFEVDDVNDKGEAIKRPARPADRFRKPFPNEAAARAANNGAYPPDLSLVVKARPNGARYIFSLLQGYDDLAKMSADDKKKLHIDDKFKLQPGMNFNKHFPGMQIAMAKPLNEGQITFVDGSKNDLPSMSRDIVTFLAWASEPKMEDRKRTGVRVAIFLLILTGLMYAVKRKVWADAH